MFMEPWPLAERPSRLLLSSREVLCARLRPCKSQRPIAKATHLPVLWARTCSL